MSVSSDPLLEGRYGVSSPVLVSGQQALVRALLLQAAADRRAGLSTEGLVSGYRGSPVSTLDRSLAEASALLDAAGVRRLPGINEDLALTQLWGAQRAGLRADRRVDGVFALWYGKAPGLDRSMDALRHAAGDGVAPAGGAVAVAGDDPDAVSSTIHSRCDVLFAAAHVPVLAPSSVAEVVRLTRMGFLLSRHVGTWVGLRLSQPVAEGHAAVAPEVGAEDPIPARGPDGIGIRLSPPWAGQEAVHRGRRLPKVEEIAAALGIDADEKAPGARVGLVASGQAYARLVRLLEDAGLDASARARLGLALRRIDMPWPLAASGLRRFAGGLEALAVVEEKEPFIEDQVHGILAGMEGAPAVWGRRRGGDWLSDLGAIDARDLARVLSRLPLPELALALSPALSPRLAPEAPGPGRAPWFCPGCPHGVSTRIPEGAQASAGIGCHLMAVSMDRGTSDLAHMGAEGVGWAGEAPFVAQEHRFVNVGDGTWFHSGSLALRQAIVSGARATFKVLANDAVAMTGGQSVDGAATPDRIAWHARAEGVEAVEVVAADPKALDPRLFPPGVRIHPRRRLDAVQRRLAARPGMSVLIYHQECATTLKRKRKRGQASLPGVVAIGEAVCEGCGDCGVQSGCTALTPVETAIGPRRAVDLAACNIDRSCQDGFCPSFVFVEGGRAPTAALPSLPLPPAPPALAPAASVGIAGVGGTGVVTVAAVLAMAAHLDRLPVSVAERTGMAQKGGSVYAELRFDGGFGEVGAFGADLVLAADPVAATVGHAERWFGLHTRTVAGAEAPPLGPEALGLVQPAPRAAYRGALEGRSPGGVRWIAADALARRLLGDPMPAGMILLGAAFQEGRLPVSFEALEEAVRRNGAGVAMNLAALRAGRWLVADPAELARHLPAEPPPALPRTDWAPERLSAWIRADLADGFGPRAVARLEALLAPLADAEARAGGDGRLTHAAEVQLYRLLAPKDAYEVARLWARDPLLAPARSLGGRAWLRLHVPFLPGKDHRGRPRRVDLPEALARPAFRALAWARRLRGTWADPFRGLPEAKAATAALETYGADLVRLAETLEPRTLVAARRVVDWPSLIRGYGPVREAASAKAEAERQAAWAWMERRPAAAPAARKVAA